MINYLVYISTHTILIHENTTQYKLIPVLGMKVKRHESVTRLFLKIYCGHERSAYGEAAPSAKSLCAHFDPVCISLLPHHRGGRQLYGKLKLHSN